MNESPLAAIDRIRRRSAVYRREIVYDRDTRDYAMYLDGELIGFARTYSEAEVTLDQLVTHLANAQAFKGAS
jgi:hypothetical protein